MSRRTRFAMLLALAYLVIAETYIVVSSRIAALVANDVSELERVEEIKGVLFVVVTALGLFFSTRIAFGRLEKSAEALVKRERALLLNERRVFAGLMASTVAHDANNVLASVMSDLEELREEPETAAQTHERLSKSVERLVGLNRRLVQVARNAATSHHQPLELSRSVKDALELCRAHPATRAANVEFEGCDVTIQAHPLLIAQITTNLFVNAGEATDGKGRILVRVEATPQTAIIEVHDNGPGVPEPLRAGLFEALTTSKPEGNGMGLFSVKACAAALGGQVRVGVSPLGGALFTVELPRTQDATG